MQARKLFNRYGFKLAACSAGMYWGSQIAKNATDHFSRPAEPQNQSIELITNSDDPKRSMKAQYHMVLKYLLAIGLTPLGLTLAFKRKSKLMWAVSGLVSMMPLYIFFVINKLSILMLTRVTLHPQTMTVDLYHELPLLSTKSKKTTVEVSRLRLKDKVEGQPLKSTNEDYEFPDKGHAYDAFVNTPNSHAVLYTAIDDSEAMYQSYVLLHEAMLDKLCVERYPRKDLMYAVLSGNVDAVKSLIG